jgi:general secretion pathway protein G
LRKSRNGGFTLIELLVVIGVIGVLAAIAITNYILGLQRARQKQTMSDMKTIAMAWEARATEVKGYTAAAWSMPAEPLTPQEVEALLVPTYAKSFPRLDGWGHPYGFAADEKIGATSSATEYAIRSAGSDGKFDGNDYTPGTTNHFDCDIVYANGAFVVYPEK